MIHSITAGHISRGELDLYLCVPRPDLDSFTVRQAVQRAVEWGRARETGRHGRRGGVC